MGTETAFRDSWPFAVNEEEGGRERLPFIMWSLAHASVGCLLPSFCLLQLNYQMLCLKWTARLCVSFVWLCWFFFLFCFLVRSSIIWVQCWVAFSNYKKYRRLSTHKEKQLTQALGFNCLITKQTLAMRPAKMQFLVVRVQDRPKPLTCCRGTRERKRRGWGPAVLYKNLPLKSRHTSHWAPLFSFHLCWPRLSASIRSACGPSSWVFS